MTPTLRPPFRRGIFCGLLLTLWLTAVPAVPAAELETVRVSPDGQSFVLAQSGRSFRVWGVNYDHDSHGEHSRLLEDY